MVSDTRASRFNGDHAPFKIVFIYAIVSIAWITFSDSLVERLFRDPGLMTRVAMIKGTLFIVVTAALLYLLIHRSMRRAALPMEALLQSEKRYKALIETTQTGYIVFDIQGRVLDANMEYVRLAGRERLEDILGRSVVEWTAPYDQARNAVEIEKCFKAGFVYGLELDYVDRAGKVTPVEFNAAVVGEGPSRQGLSLCRDITDRRRVNEELSRYQQQLEAMVHERTAALEETNGRLMVEIESHRKVELALAESRNYLDRIINAIADPIFVKDRQHRWVLLNDVFCALVGNSRGALLGKSDYDLFPKSEADVFWEKDEEVFRTHQENINEEFFTAGDGKIRTIVTKKTIYIDHAGQEFIVGIIRDMTELKRAVADLQMAQQQLIQSSKMATIGQLAAGVAHEINNPTGYVINNLAQLAGDVHILRQTFGAYQKLEEADIQGDIAARNAALIDVEELRERYDFGSVMSDVMDMVEESREGAGRIKEIVSALRTFAHTDEGKKETVDFQAVMESAVGIVWNEIKFKAEISREYTDGIRVTCNPQQMNQVFVNLLVNALDAIAQNGRITLRTWREENMACAEVADEGAGMAQDVQARVFEPFFTTKPVGKGTGLGLSLSYNIVQQHGGRISVASVPGKGTSVIVRIPAGEGS
ncbi:MAG: PAS domain S-box protein [Candidatus Omnitrophica bacterium]|nr:PAS domain S-box protein [Candidatus Omnitrophota bacterium]